MAARKNVEIGEEGKPFTLEEYDVHLRRLGDALQSAPSLVNYLEKNHPEGPFRTRVPIGLISEDEIKPGERFEFTLRPFFPIRPWAMVLADETATCFDVHEFKIGNVFTIADAEPVPLDTCAVRYVAGSANPDKFLDVQGWGGGMTVSPAMRCVIVAINRGTRPVQFRGILWCRCSLY